MAERVAGRSPAAPRRVGAAGLDAPRYAGLAPRAFAFLLDSLVLFAQVMLFATASFLNVYFRTNGGLEDPSDATIWASVIILAASVPCWLLLNLVLGLRRGQSVGQYVVGLCVRKENGDRVGLPRWVLYWLALHPVLFHPILALPWALLAWLAFSLAGNDALTLAAVTVAILCLAAPLVALASAATDPRRRALHDRVAGVAVTRLT